MNKIPIESQGLACDMTAIPLSSRAEHVASATQIFQSAQTIGELDDGYLLQLPNEPAMFMSLASFVENERRCCPFFRFGLEVEPHGGSLWLSITGDNGAKQLLQMVLDEHLDEATRKRLIQTGDDAHLDQTVTNALPLLAASLRKALSTP